MNAQVRVLEPGGGPAGSSQMAIFIGGSAGGIEAVAELLSRLPGNLAAPVLVVLHVGMTGTSVLPAILDRVGQLHAVTPIDGESLVDGVVYVAPRGQHMIVEHRRVRLNAGPAEHGLRPAIDPLFRSAARAYGPRSIGVILSGMLDDGTAGLSEIRARGGWTLVQAPDEASFPNMPQSAIANVAVDHVLPTIELAAQLEQLVATARRRPGAVEPPPLPSPAVSELEEPDPAGMRTDITCPQCGGVLWEEVEGPLTIYRCRAGHVFSADSLLAVQGEGLDTAIWRSIRMLYERGALLRRLAARATARGRERSALYFEEQADDAFQRATDMRRAAAHAPRQDTPPASGEPTKDAIGAEQT
jgi:two-component system, chemotaxis family, protein-glutamate methylesterase/glutaminase